jgi:glycosyltransferase involved in cell wall biosynthesis
MKWVITSPYIKSEGEMKSSLWETIEQLGNQRFELSAACYSHNRSRKKSSVKCWWDYWQHTSGAWKLALSSSSGVITCFPQLPVLMALRKIFSNKKVPIVAWTFNLGKLPIGIKKNITSYLLKKINIIIVHSTYEKHGYAKYFELPEDKFEFVHLYRPKLKRVMEENTEKPFLLSMGTANRDYATLFSVVGKLNYPTVVVAAPHILKNLKVPSCVTILTDLTLDECRSLAQQARINVVPVDNDMTASGQVTIVEAMMYGSAVIATDTIGSRDYINNGETGLLVKNKSLIELENAISLLWNDELMREKISYGAYEYANNYLTQEKAAERLHSILKDVKNYE